MKTKAKTWRVKQPMEGALRPPLAGSPDCGFDLGSDLGFDLGFDPGFDLGFDLGFDHVKVYSN